MFRMQYQVQVGYRHDHTRMVHCDERENIQKQFCRMLVRVLHLKILYELLIDLYMENLEEGLNFSSRVYLVEVPVVPMKAEVCRYLMELHYCPLVKYVGL